MNGRAVWKGIALLGWSLLAAGWSQGGVPSDEERFLTGLRERRLYALAVRQCEKLLATNQLDPVLESAVVREWLRTLAEQAAASAESERAARWLAADEAADQWIAKHAAHPRLLLVALQRALNQLSRGELARLEAELAGDPDRAASEAREVLREAAKGLAELETETEEALASAARQNPTPPALTSDELNSLRNHLRFQRARAARNQGLSYPAGSADRLAAVTQGVEYLTALVRELPATESLGRSGRLELAIARRILREESESRALLAEVHTDDSPPELRLAARAELVRLELDANRPDTALQVLATGRLIDQIASPELDLAHVETYLALWHQSAEKKQTADGDKWRQQSLQAVRLIEQSHGRYWARRAEILLVRAGGQRGDASVDILRRAADDFFLKGAFEEAIATYDKGAAAARTSGDPGTAFELAFKAALIEQQRKRFAEAARRFRDLARSQSSDPRGAQAHFLAVANLGQAWKADPQQREAYLTVLEEYAAQWPQTPAANDVRLWLGALREERRDWPGALAAFQAVDLNSPQAVPAIQAAERCLRRILEQSVSPPVDFDLAKARQWFDAGLLDPSTTSPDAWTDPLRWRLLAAARLRLAAPATELPAVEQRLRAALDAPPPAPSPWPEQAREVLFQLAARQPGREAELTTLAEQLPPAPQRLLAIVSFLGREGTGNTSRQTSLAKVQLQLIARIPVEQLSAAERSRVDRFRAQAEMQAGNVSQGLALMAAVAAKVPQDSGIQREWGEMLLASPDPKDWARAVSHWREFVAKSPPRSKSWFLGKLAVARALVLTGDKASAAKLIRYLQATEDLAKTGLERDFADLLRKCEP